MRNKKVKLAAGLAAIMVVGGTWAYFNQTMSIENPFSTGKYDSVVREDFKPDDGENWQPGATVNKDVVVSNTGDYDVFVRVKFDETWENKDNSSWKKIGTGLSEKTEQDDPNDGLIVKDYSVVKKNLAKGAAEKWFYNTEDGYWYYKTNLNAGSNTGTFLDSVTLMENADMGSYIVTNYYTKAETAPMETEIGSNDSDAETKWVAYTGELPDGAKHNMVITRQDPEKPGYGNAEYTLAITVQTVQATEAAMKDVFKLSAVPTDCIWTFKEK